MLVERRKADIEELLREKEMLQNSSIGSVNKAPTTMSKVMTNQPANQHQRLAAKNHRLARRSESVIIDSSKFMKRSGNLATIESPSTTKNIEDDHVKVQANNWEFGAVEELASETESVMSQQYDAPYDDDNVNTIPDKTHEMYDLATSAKNMFD